MHKKWLYGVIIGALAVGAVYFFDLRTRTNFTNSPYVLGKKPILIILNGVSCVGKSTTIAAFQDISPVPFFLLGMDIFTGAVLPEKWYRKCEETYPRGVTVTVTESPEGQLMEVHYGEVAQNLIELMHGCAVRALEMGNNVILDHVLYDPAWFKDLNDRAIAFDPIWVKVSLPLETVIERENIRKKAPVSSIRNYIDRVHEGVVYDLEIDTSALTPHEAANRIWKLVQRRVQQGY